MGRGNLELPVAVSAEEVSQYGCPYCGYRSFTFPISCGGTSVATCGECNRSCAILAAGVTRSRIGFGDFYPELVKHPRFGTPSHGKADKRPEQGGEYFYSRGIGSEANLKCLVCGTSSIDGGPVSLYLHNIAAYVTCKTAGERIVAMFPKGGARLDYREHEPDYVQVKVGACDHDLPNLEQLHTLTKENGGVITSVIIQTAMVYSPS